MAQQNLHKLRHSWLKLADASDANFTDLICREYSLSLSLDLQLIKVTRRLAVILPIDSTEMCFLSSNYCHLPPPTNMPCIIYEPCLWQAGAQRGWPKKQNQQPRQTTNNESHLYAALNASGAKRKSNWVTNYFAWALIASPQVDSSSSPLSPLATSFHSAFCSCCPLKVPAKRTKCLKYAQAMA